MCFHSLLKTSAKFVRIFKQVTSQVFTDLLSNSPKHSLRFSPGYEGTENMFYYYYSCSISSQYILKKYFKITHRTLSSFILNVQTWWTAYVVARCDERWCKRICLCYKVDTGMSYMYVYTYKVQAHLNPRWHLVINRDVRDACATFCK